MKLIHARWIDKFHQLIMAEIAGVDMWPAREPEAKGWLRDFTAKDWIAVPLSILAFILSLFSAYFTLLRRSDDIRLVVHSHPVMSWSLNNKALNILGGHSLTFINAGNRPAAIVKADYFVVDRAAKCESYHESTFTMIESDFQPFVLKENEVATRDLNLWGSVYAMENKLENPSLGDHGWVGRPVWNYEIPETGTIEIPHIPGMTDDGKASIKYCYRFAVSTASNAFAEKIFEISQDEIEKGIWRTISVELVRQEKPISLYSYSSMVFWD